MEAQRAEVEFNSGLTPLPCTISVSTNFLTYPSSRSLLRLSCPPCKVPGGACRCRRLSLKTSLRGLLGAWTDSSLLGLGPLGWHGSGGPRCACRFINGQAEGPEWRARTRPFLKAPASPRAPTAVLPTIRDCRRATRVGESRMVTMRKKAWEEWRACRPGECDLDRVPSVASTLISGWPSSAPTA